jgi:type III pantothenate kinase
MLLAIDAGNTNIVFALYANDKRKHLWRCKTDSARTGDEYAAWLLELFRQKEITFNDVEDVIISSVVPDADQYLRQLSHHYFSCEPVFISHTNAGMKTALDNPHEIGADRLVNARAAMLKYGVPAIVIDFGTATTFDVINPEGVYCGGVIAPGVNLSMEALHLAAAKLPKVMVEKPENVIGNGTVSAIQSGLFWGYVGLIEGTLSRIETELGTKPAVIATGGLASLFADTISVIDHVDDDLTLNGMVNIYQCLTGQQAA